MNVDEQNHIVEFEEKPRKPKSNLASMGVYIFTWKVLREYLIADDRDPSSKNDFGKNIIPKMLGDGRVMLAYAFESYWKDVGTIASLWEANMDLLKVPPEFDLNDPRWKIYARSPVMPPHYIGSTARVERSMIAEGGEMQRHRAGQRALRRRADRRGRGGGGQRGHAGHEGGIRRGHPPGHRL